MSNQPKEQYTKDLIECPHCSNKSQMEILAYGERDENLSAEEEEHGIEYIRKWTILLCSNCKNIIVLQWTYFSEWDDYEYDKDGSPIRIPGILNETLYPSSKDFIGTPNAILNLYRDAKRLTLIDAESALVKIRRLLEAVCSDQKAEGRDLFKKLEYLANNGIIPSTIAKVADELRKIGNLGAHEDSELQSKITESDVNLALKLSETLLEYVYEAPAMLDNLQERLKKLKPKS